MNIAWKKLMAFVILCEGVGILGAGFTIKSIPAWYAFLNKPSFSPPNWLFGPVWTVLYLLMSIAGYLLWQNRGAGRAAHLALKFFFIQLILNGIWTPLFFGAHAVGLAFLEIILLWLAIVITIICSFKSKAWAGILLLPYIAWATFAAILNFSLWQLNK